MTTKLEFKKVNGDFMAFENGRTYLICPPSKSTANKFSVIVEFGHPNTFESLGWYSNLFKCMEVCCEHVEKVNKI